ncbi:30S ribosomal protein S6e [Candidatus Micrarchaeota archaeon]|nr:30S ribosomal protein S6e [Candidatus Micrarchaeota archaeon]
MKLVISEPKTGKSFQTELDKVKSKVLNGMRVGQDLDGSLIGCAGYKFRITGGTDKDGFPMRADMLGMERKRVLLSKGPGFRPETTGERRKKTIRGNTIGEDIAQVNLKVEAEGATPFVQLLGISVEPKPEKQEEKSNA